MNKRLILSFISLCTLFLVLTACQQGEKEPTFETAEEAAEAFLVHLSKEEYEEAYELVDAEMEKAIDVKDLEDVWVSLEQSIGEHIEFEYQSTEIDEPYTFVIIATHHSKEDMAFRVTVDEQLNIAGFFIV